MLPVQEKTRRLYWAATRAVQRLVITYVGDVPEAIKAILFSHLGDRGGR